jgi:DNA-binding NarL/FixJ family response regulator
MKPQTKINLTTKNSQRYAEAVRLYRSGLSMAEVGQRLAISGERVRQYLVKSGVTERMPAGERAHLLSLRRLEPQRDRLTKMTQAGKWPTAIARELAMCPETVMRWLRLLGITPAAPAWCQ